MTTTHLLYLHGFRSSPLSVKAKKMAAIARDRFPHVVWWCPSLAASPQQAMYEVFARISAWPEDKNFQSMAVIGSSLGGFYATCVAEHMRCKAVLLNPAVDPARDLAQYIGEQTSWHEPAETFFFKPEFVDELRSLEVGDLQHPEDYLAIIAKGDEVLDWREMAGRYSQARLRLQEGGDHALSDFDDHLPAILDFLDLGA
ncbi:MAG: YqiA/YcfP family alpha/beta fold hydrolase [Polaromonas sp.]